MELAPFMKKYADEIGGEFIEYTPSYSVIIIPVSGKRFQTVVGNVKESVLYNRKVITFSSKVCHSENKIDWKNLMEQTAFFNYCRFVINEEFLQIEAVVSLGSVKEEDLKEILQEVANLADQYEMKLTGTDIN